MKIGFSLGRCIQDIVEGKVDVDDVLIIITSTDFDIFNDNHWYEIWDTYSSVGYWKDADSSEEQTYRNIIVDLWEEGKIHQPRQFGARPKGSPYKWLETVLVSEDEEKNPTAKKLMDQYKTVTGLLK